jgi:hypothetical protein
MADTRAMLYCTRMNRPCTCGELTVYDRHGCIVLANSSGMRCLTNGEVRNALNMLLDEWRKRFDGGVTSTLILDA